MKRVFVVGRRTGRATTVVVVRIENLSSRIVGPWTIKAVVSEN
jgi:hypothetical protein